MIEEKLIKLLFEGNENLVVKNEDRFHLEDYIQYYNKPGIIVAIIKGKTGPSVQQYPVGAVDNFRFMKITNENAITLTEKNNGKSYDTIMSEYEEGKNGILESWTQQNQDKVNGLKQKYGDKFIGLDIVQNDRKIQPKEDKEQKDDKEDSKEEKGRDIKEVEPITNQQKKPKYNTWISQLGQNIGTYLKEQWENQECGLCGYANSEKQPKFMKSFSREIGNVKCDEEDVKFFIQDDDGMLYPVSTIDIINLDGRKFVMCSFNDKCQNACTLKSFGDKLEKDNDIQSMTQDISGILAQKQLPNDEELTECDNCYPKMNYRGIVGVKYNGKDKIMIVLEKEKQKLDVLKARKNKYR